MNIDFADVKAATHQMAIMCYGTADGDNRSSEAVNNALNNPFFDQADMRNAKGIIINVCASSLEKKELVEIMTHVQNIGKEGIEAIPGLMIDESYGDEISVTIIATGLRRFNLDEFRSTTYIPSKSINPSNNLDTTNSSDGYVNLNNKKINIEETLKAKGLNIFCLLEESIDYLVTDKNGLYVDCTYGRGGHSKEILKNLHKRKIIFF